MSSRCEVQDCDRPAAKRGMCGMHYRRQLRNGTTDRVRYSRTSRVCEVDGCDKSSDNGGRGMCSMHYSRYKTEGSPGEAAPRQAAFGRGCINTAGYRTVSCPIEFAAMATRQRRVLEHRLIVARRLGRPLFAHETVHHRNGDRLDNRPGNLELFTGLHGTGANVKDAVARAKELLALYEPEALS